MVLSICHDVEKNNTMQNAMKKMMLEAAILCQKMLNADAKKPAMMRVFGVFRAT